MGDASDESRPLTLAKIRGDPATTGLAIFITIPAIYGLLLRHLENAAVDPSFVGLEMRIWAAIATVSVILWVALGVSGFRRIRDRRARSEGNARQPSVQWLIVHSVAFTAMVSGLAAALWLNGGAGETLVPIQAWAAIPNALLALGALSALPWVLLSWWVREECIKLNDEIGSIGTLEAGGSHGGDILKANSAVGTVLLLWRSIRTSALALGVIVSASVFQSGSLRNALTSWAPLADEAFPASYVLLYGAVFAAALAAIVFPAFFTWRRAAAALVDTVLGPPSAPVPTRKWQRDRAALQSRLEVGAGIPKGVTSTIISILSPVATAAVTAVIPLGS